MEDGGLSDMQRLRQSVEVPWERVANPAFVVVAGLPGAGKSYFSRRLAERLPSVILESDALRKALVPRPTYSARENQRLFGASHGLIEELLRGGTSVILDATNLQERHRERLYRIAERLRVRLILVWVEAPADVIRDRLRDRSRGVDPQDHSTADWGVYSRMRGRAERIGRGYFAVDTSRDIVPVIDKIVRQARR